MCSVPYYITIDSLRYISFSFLLRAVNVHTSLTCNFLSQPKACSIAKRLNVGKWFAMLRPVLRNVFK